MALRRSGERVASGRLKRAQNLPLGNIFTFAGENLSEVSKKRNLSSTRSWSSSPSSGISPWTSTESTAKGEACEKPVSSTTAPTFSEAETSAEIG